jgi:hypothetical protein
MKQKVLISALTLALALPFRAIAQSINCIDALSFGDIITCGVPGTVKVRPSNALSSYSGCLSAGSVPAVKALCRITQTPTASVPAPQPLHISIDSPTYAIGNGGAQMNVNDFNIVTDNGGRTHAVTAATVNIPIGATLHVGGSQPEGIYDGSFGITVVFE